MGTIFHGRTKPLQLWDRSCKDNSIQLVYDESISCYAIELQAPNISQCCIKCPQGDKSLAIQLPILGIIVKNLDKFFSFEVTIIDTLGNEKRFRASNYQPEARVKPYICCMPLRMDKGWNYIQVNYAELCRRAYKIGF